MVSDKPRRSAGMIGRPRNDMPDRVISTAPPGPRAEPAQAERASVSRHPKPTVLMGEVVAPRPKPDRAEIARQRDLFRAFMTARRLSPTEWARAAQVPAGEVLAFLTGKSRAIAPESLEKLARAADCRPEDFFR